jgi:hypothetical protein
VRVDGSCSGWMELRRAGSMERCLRCLGSVRCRFSFCFVVLTVVLRMILWGFPFGYRLPVRVRVGFKDGICIGPSFGFPQNAQTKADSISGGIERLIFERQWTM